MKTYVRGLRLPHPPRHHSLGQNLEQENPINVILCKQSQLCSLRL